MHAFSKLVSGCGGRVPCESQQISTYYIKVTCFLFKYQSSFKILWSYNYGISSMDTGGFQQT